MKESKECFHCRKRISPLSTFVKYEDTNALTDEYGQVIYFCSVSCLLNQLGAEIIDPKLEKIYGSA